jgi:hypothetical protein
MSGYMSGKHGNLTNYRGANSGLALMSKYELTDFSQNQWIVCFDVDCLANKGWISADIVKDNFTIRIYTLHTHVKADKKPSFLILYEK